MNWRDVWILYRRELRSALRERAIVVSSILLPIFMYPLMLWLMFTGITFVQGQASREVSRIALFGMPEAHSEIRDSLAANERVEIVAEPETVAAATELVREGELDAVLEFQPGPAADAGLPANFRLRIGYDRSESRSSLARSRVEEVIDDYRDRVLEREALALGAGAEELVQFRIERENLSTGGEMGALLLGYMIPLFMIIMVALGCLYPAIDTTAGERERATWETLMTVSASRTSLVVAKYLYVATLGVAAGVLQVIALTASLGVIIAPLLSDGGAAEEFSVELPFLAIMAMVVGAIALGLFFAAAMMILASFARTFKDGQAMVTPVYWLAIIPFFLGQSPDQQLDLTVALIPIANVAQIIRDAIQGTYNWPLIGLSLVEMLVLVALCLWLARTILRFEELLMGSYDGSLFKFVRERLLPGSRGARAGGPA